MDRTLITTLIVTVEEVPGILRVLEPTRHEDETVYWLSRLERAAKGTDTAVEWLVGENICRAVSRHRDELPMLWGKIQSWKKAAE